MPKADLDTDYIKVTLARPVPEHGQGRVIIVKTYKDAKSYFTDDKGIVFNRPLGITRNKVVLPPGYEVTGLTVPSQILTEKDGRIAIAFLHAGSGDAPLVLHARKDAKTGQAALPHAATGARSWEAPFAGTPERSRLGERAHQDRDIVYFLEQPATHSFSLYHDYTESRPGVSAYANVVREGSKASNPSAYVVDNRRAAADQADDRRGDDGGEDQRGRRGRSEGRNSGDPPSLRSRPARACGYASRRTYTAPVSYRLDGDEMVFDRSLGRPRNAVVLPSGWYCTASATPGNREPAGRRTGAAGLLG